MNRITTLFATVLLAGGVSASPPVTLVPIPVGNPEFDAAKGGWSLSEETGARYWSPVEHGLSATEEWYEGEVAFLPSKSGAIASIPIPDQVVAEGGVHRIAFTLARWGPDRSRIEVSIEDADGSTLVEALPIEAGLWKRCFVDLDVPVTLKAEDGCRLVFRSTGSGDGEETRGSGSGTETAILLDKVSIARVGTDEPGFKSIFNGRDLEGWVGNTEGYGIEDGAIRTYPERAGGDLRTREQYDDFVLRFDFKIPPGANNGIAVRAPLTGDAAYVGMEIQVIDNAAPGYAGLKPWQRHGAIYGIAPSLRGYQVPTGSWNHEEIRVEGRRVRVTLNGVVIMDVDLDEAVANGTLSGAEHPGLDRRAGHLGFCGHGAVVHYKDLRVKRISGADRPGQR
ncbi:MAG: DUF1080 domain-containing protein [Phycisphaera sp.]|nr:DUF1080 domain-containing protein [Phycisphaera sp.]